MFARYRWSVLSVFRWLRSCLDLRQNARLRRRQSFGEGPLLDRHSSADTLCDELLSHMLECETCLNPFAKYCPVYREFQAAIGASGIVAQPALYAV